MEKWSQYIVLSWDPEESVPPATGCFHGLKSENVFFCESKLLYSIDNYKIVNKTGTLNNVELDIILTHYISNENPHENKLLRGYLYINNKEYEIKSSYTYCSLQIGKWCYDNIQIVQLYANIFD
jgi:hypothetical protein